MYSQLYIEVKGIY